MNATTKQALESVLFFDEETPAEELVARFANEPLRLNGEASALFAEDGSLFSLWRQGESYSLLAADLHSCARDAGLPSSGLVLRLPSSIDGLPLRRISSAAFRSWLSYGISIRLLILPEGMEEISDEALSPLCFERCHIPSTLKRFGARNVRWNKLTCYPREVRYSASSGNKRFTAKDGSLFSKDETLLIAQRYPYEGTVTLPQKTSAIRADAFMHTPTPPKTILCPDSLKTTEDLVDKFAVWACRQDGELARNIRERNGYTISKEGCEKDGIVYDKTDKSASLVLCRPERTEAKIPDTIDSSTVRVIGKNSLTSAIGTLVLPTYTRIVEDGNVPTIRGKLVLNEGLEHIGARCFTQPPSEEPVRVPRSVQSIGNGSFSGAVLSFDAIGSVVSIPKGSHSLFESCRYVRNECGELVYGSTCAEGGASSASRRLDTSGASAGPLPDDEAIVPFDMKAYDDMLASGRFVRNKTMALVRRFESDVTLPQTYARTFSQMLRSDSDATLELVASANDAQRIIERLAQTEFYEDGLAEKQCELLRVHRKTKALHALMNLIAQRSAKQPAKPSARFSF